MSISSWYDSMPVAALSQAQGRDVNRDLSIQREPWIRFDNKWKGRKSQAVRALTLFGLLLLVEGDAHIMLPLLLVPLAPEQNGTYLNI
jgi:hypothetical protein